MFCGVLMVNLTVPRTKNPSEDKSMLYKLELITSVEMVNDLIQDAERDLRKLNARSITMSLNTEASASNAVDYTADLQALQAELDSTLTIIAALPEGSARKKKEIGKQKELESKIYNLTLLSESRSPKAVVEKEYEKDLVERRKTATQEYLDALLARKADLAA